MARSNGISAPETAELLNKLYVGFFFCFSIISGGHALEYLLTDESLAIQIVIGIRQVALVTAIVTIGSFLWISRKLQRADRLVFGGSEFFHLVFFKAMVISWFFTLVSLMLLGVFSESIVNFFGEGLDSTAMPPDFYLKATVSMMLFVYCITYVFLYRSAADME